MNRCVFCGGPVEKKEVTFSHEHDGHVFLIKNVPAEVCLHCGEKLYSAKTTDQILAFSKESREPIETIQVPLYDFAKQKEVA